MMAVAVWVPKRTARESEMVKPCKAGTLAGMIHSIMPNRTFGRRLLDQEIQLLDHHCGSTHVPAQHTLGHDENELIRHLAAVIGGAASGERGALGAVVQVGE